jgi:hypothetical protein
MRELRMAGALLFLSIVMLGCASAEERASGLHSESLEAKNAGDAVRHEELLQRIVNDYSSTQTAAEAKKELETLRLNREALVSNTVSVMRLIVTGQVLFLGAHGRYAMSLEELSASKAGGFDRAFLNPEKGYRYEMEAEKSAYLVTATPTLPALNKHFFANNEGYVHEETGEPATPGSPITKY